MRKRVKKKSVNVKWTEFYGFALTFCLKKPKLTKQQKKNESNENGHTGRHRAQRLTMVAVESKVIKRRTKIVCRPKMQRLEKWRHCFLVLFSIFSTDEYECSFLFPSHFWSCAECVESIASVVQVSFSDVSLGWFYVFFISVFVFDIRRNNKNHNQKCCRFECRWR